MTTFILILSLGVAVPSSMYVLVAILSLILDRNTVVSRRMVVTYFFFLVSWAVAIQTFVGWG
ncbi:gp5.1 [Bacillus phage SPO1]|uniref:Gp5.1 n=3 Tax=Okubovirus TaxID=1857845 RepID=B6V2N1_BPSP1|nr:gp5.1 [Bacillus phage SPO1]YP_008770003.1 hypothetical protein CampHawk_69 [Bacillus phage CampHawk]APZ82306.1 hypothetical protein Goe2_c07000 [Bacillus phage vB_BsuM-Goe2]UNY49014.1 hypothetical protein sp82g_77 [Bacillus phage SP82G]WCS68709.1 hypothetical protein Goe19_00680 [Bacillus phage vB_BsuM-Goe19]WIT26402.1 hypothetical protein [Bacillus phage SPO1L4]ACI90972.1 gp5.1 [Bacillus phage SPO1]